MKRRIRDPVHGLIVLGDDDLVAPRDATIWKLLDTPELQRLRRIRQLGVSEFTFPGATHSRFAHSVGVFHNARRLVGVLDRLLPADRRNPHRAEIAVFAALLHDVGHGPFSHAFESVQEGRGAAKNHEDWSADIIRNSEGRIFRVLEEYRRGLAADVADLLREEVPRDAYHAVVSSSFDADRLDYLRRDRMMTGSGAGAIDFDWLLDNLRIADVPLGADADDAEEGTQPVLCLEEKALQAAESFLLARYHLFEQVYLHKTTRGMEKLVGVLLAEIANAAACGEHDRLGLDDRDPLVRFFAPGGETLTNYLRLDDMSVWAAIARMTDAADDTVRRLARRFLERKPLKVLDVEREVVRLPGEEAAAWRQRVQACIDRLDAFAAAAPWGSVMKDSAPLGIYSEVGADQARAHKRLNILLGGRPFEITAVSDAIKALQPKRNIVRYYFTDESARRSAREDV